MNHHDGSNARRTRPHELWRQGGPHYGMFNGQFSCLNRWMLSQEGTAMLAYGLTRRTIWLFALCAMVTLLLMGAVLTVTGWRDLAAHNVIACGPVYYVIAVARDVLP